MIYGLVCISADKGNRKRKSVASTKELTRRLDELERTCEEILEAMSRLLRSPVRKRKPIGFRAKIPKK